MTLTPVTAVRTWTAIDLTTQSALCRRPSASRNNVHQDTMTIELECFPKRWEVSLHLELDLRFHKAELLKRLVGMQVAADLDERLARFFNFTFSKKVAGRIWHKSHK